MITYVRTRIVKPGKFERAISFLKEYKSFVESELDQDLHLGAEMGRVGTVVSWMTFENAQAWEDALSKLRSNSSYVTMLDQSADYFEDKVREQLISEIPL